MVNICRYPGNHNVSYFSKIASCSFITNIACFHNLCIFYYFRLWCGARESLVLLYDASFPLIFAAKHFFTSTNSTRSFRQASRLDIDYSRPCNGLLRFPDMLAYIAVVLKKLNCKEFHAVKTTSENGFFLFLCKLESKICSIT